MSKARRVLTSPRFPRGAPVTLAGKVSTVISQSLKVGQRVLVPVAIGANGIGISNVTLKITGPNGYSVAHSWPIQARAPQLDVARDEIAPFAPNQSYVANHDLIADLYSGTSNVALTVSSAHGYNNVPGLLRWLDKYPYGCIEQTTSRAMPLLVFNDLSDLAGLPRDQALHAREQEAIDAVLDMQNYAGNFGMWAPGNDADPWISVFALDFLFQAKQKNYVVPNDALRRGAAWLKSESTSDSADDATRAYAFYVLARVGQVNISDLRYFSDTRGAGVQDRYRQRADRRGLRRSGRPFARELRFQSGLGYGDVRRSQRRFRQRLWHTAAGFGGYHRAGRRKQRGAVDSGAHAEGRSIRYAPERHDHAREGVDAARGL